MSYTISYSGTNIIAVNDATGQTEFTDTNISSILTSVNNVISDGSTITIDGSGGAYNPPSQIVFTKSMTLRGINNPIFNWNVLSTDIFIFLGQYITDSNITADIYFNSNIISVVSIPQNVMIGDYLILKDNLAWNPINYPSITKGELHKISNIDRSTNSITIVDNTLQSYNVSNSGYVYYLKPITVEVDGITIIGPSQGPSQDYRGINIQVCQNSIVHNCSVHKCGLRAIFVTNSYNTTVEYNDIDDTIMPGYGYGVDVGDASAYTLIQNNHFGYGRHCVAAGGGSGNAGGIPREITVQNNTFDNYYVPYPGCGCHTVDAHGCVESFYVYNNIINSPNDYAIRSGAKITKMIGNTINGGYGIMERETSNNGIPYPGYSLEIINNTLTNTQYIYNGSVDRLIIENNNITSIVDAYIVVSGANYTRFKGNTINGSDGINTLGYNLSPGYIFDISDNIFNDSMAIFYGNNGGKISQLNIINNTITGISGNMRTNSTRTIARFWDADSFNITNNRFDITNINTNGEWGINANDSTNGIIQNNSITNPYVSGIDLKNTTNTNISGNTVNLWGSGYYGINLDTGSDNNIVTNNTLCDPSSPTNGIQNLGTNNIIQNNTFLTSNCTVCLPPSCNLLIN